MIVERNSVEDGGGITSLPVFIRFPVIYNNGSLFGISTGTVHGQTYGIRGELTFHHYEARLTIYTMISPGYQFYFLYIL